MTITITTSSSGPYIAAAQTTFAVTFQSAGPSEIEVLLNGVVQDPTLYVFTRDLDGTGQVVFLSPISGSVLINSNPIFQQPTSFARFGAFFPDLINTPLDRIGATLIYLKARLALLFPASFNSAEGRAGKYLAWDASGNPTAASGTGADAGLRTDMTLANGATLVGFQQTGVGSRLRTIQKKGEDAPTVLDFIPVSEHAAILAKTSTYDCSSDIAAAHFAHAHVIVPKGRYVIGAMVEIGAGGIGQRGLHCMGGVEFIRLNTAITTPLFWLKTDDCYLTGSGVGASRITTTARCPDGIVLIGHRDMATSHTNLFNCELSGFRISGPVVNGQTTGAPDVAVKLCNPQLGGLASYFHHVHNIRAQNVNYGFHLHGFANANYLSNLEGWYIGNGTLSAHRAMFFFDGAQQNSLFNCFFHFSAGSTCWKFRDNNNTGVAGGFSHVPSLNALYGQTEQDPTGVSGLGIDAPDTCTAVFNTLVLKDNIASNTLGPNFANNNNISLLGSNYVRGNTRFREPVRSLGFTAVGAVVSPADTTSATLSVDTATQRGQLRTIWEGVDWRRQEYYAREHYFYNDGLIGATIDAAGINLPTGDVLKVNAQQVIGGRLAALPANATDLATALTLINAMKDRLKTTGGHGLVAD